MINHFLDNPHRPLKSHLSSHPPLCLNEGASLPTYSLLPFCFCISLYWGIKPPQDKGPPLLLLSGKIIICYNLSRSIDPSLYLAQFAD